MAEGVKLLLVVTGVTVAEIVMRRVDPSSFTQQGVKYFVLLAVSCQDHWSHIVRESKGECKQTFNDTFP